MEEILGALPTELYPACFDWEQPKPLKIGIHRDLVAAGRERAAVQRALARYCHRPLYRRALRAGAARIDLHGQPAGVVTEQEVRQARRAATPHAGPVAACESLPPDATPILKEQLAPGRLDLVAKFSELPASHPVPGGIRIAIPTGAGTVTAILPAKAWRKLEQAAKDYSSWAAALSGSLAQLAEGQIILQHPAVQVFEARRAKSRE